VVAHDKGDCIKQNLLHHSLRVFFFNVLQKNIIVGLK
jgi:hypothetical protein